MSQTPPPDQPRPSAIALENPFGEGETDHRKLPSLHFIKSVLWRNALPSLVVFLCMLPFILLYMLVVKPTHQSIVMVRFDSLDDQDLHNSNVQNTSYDDALALLSRDLASEDYFLELAHRFVPEDSPSPFRSLPIIGKIIQKRHANNTANADTATTVERRAKQLRSSIQLDPVPNTNRQAALQRLTAHAASPEDAQRLASVAMQTLIDRYYEEQARRTRVLYESMEKFLANEQVKLLIEKAKDLPDEKANEHAKKADPKQDAVERKVREQTLAARMRDITAEIAANSSQKAKLQDTLAEVAQRYGPYHPRVQSLQRQIRQLELSSSKDRELATEKRSLEEQLAELEAQPLTAGAPSEALERIEKTIQRLSNRKDLYLLERVKVEQQLRNPAERTRMTVLGTPTIELEPIVAARKKALTMGLAACVGLMLALALTREVFSGAARDSWRISWRYNLPCLASYTAKDFALVPTLDPATITQLRNQLSDAPKDSKKINVLLKYRQLTHWIKNNAHGRIVLFTRASDDRTYGAFLDHVANLLGSDYAGRTLFVDLNPLDPVRTELLSKPPSLLEILADKATIEQASTRADATHAYDIISLPFDNLTRLSELVSSANFVTFLKNARAKYAIVLINGFGPGRFVENGILSTRSTDSLVVIDGRTAKFAALSQLTTHLPPARLRGFVHLEG